jgi:signal transduction histidine kinase
MAEKKMTTEAENKLLRSEITRLNKQLKQQNKEIDAMINGSRLLLASESFLETAEAIFNFCRELTGARAGYIALLNKEKMENEVVYLEPGGLPCKVSLDLPMPIRGLRAEAYKKGVPVYDNNYAASSHLEYMPKGHIPLNRVMFAPIKIDGETIGLMGLGEKESNFTETDKEYAGIMAEFLAIALINSRTLEELKKSQLQLNNLIATKDKLFSIIAHDLKNPFAALTLTAELIIRQIKLPEPDRKKLADYARVVHDSAVTGRQLLDDLLKWSMTQFGSMEFSLTDINMLHAIEESLATIEIAARNKNIDITYDVPHNIRVPADAGMLNTILRNLVSNAVKFTPPGGKVHVSAHRQKKFIVVSVKDNGVGIPKEAGKRLFRIDKKYSTQGTGNEKGTGFGLILCKEFVEKHGGSLSFKSKEGKGSEFVFTLSTNSAGI